MALTIAAVRTGHDPVGKLPEASFHCQLDRQLTCPKCDATFNLIVDYDRSLGRHFEEESRRPILMLQKAIMMGHGDNHRVVHFESAGVVVTSFLPPKTFVDIAAENAEIERARDRRVKPLRPAMGRPQ